MKLNINEETARHEGSHGKEVDPIEGVLGVEGIRLDLFAEGIANCLGKNSKILVKGLPPLEKLFKNPMPDDFNELRIMSYKVAGKFFLAVYQLLERKIGQYQINKDYVIWERIMLSVFKTAYQIYKRLDYQEFVSRSSNEKMAEYFQQLVVDLVIDRAELEAQYNLLNS